MDNDEISIVFFLNFIKFCYYDIEEDDDVINEWIWWFCFDNVSVSSDYLNIIMGMFGNLYCLIVIKIVE